MKRFIGLLFLLSIAAIAGPVIIFNPLSYPVPNKVTQYIPITDEVAYYGLPNALVITDRVSQTDSGVTFSNLLNYCVVDGQIVRLYNQSETDLINSNNTYLAQQAIIDASNALVQTKYDARVLASNVVNAADGISLYLRATAEANWFYINQIRTNQGYPALTRAAYKNMIDTNIFNFGQ